MGVHDLGWRQCPRDYDDLSVDAISGNLRVETGPGEKHGSGVQLAARLVQSGDDLGSDDEGEIAG